MQNTLSKIKTVLESDTKLIIELYFCRKTRTNYITYKPNVGDAVKDDLIKLLKEKISGKELLKPVQFNPTRCCVEGELEVCNTNYLGNYNEVIGSLSSPETVSTTINPNDLNFYCLEIKDIEESYNYKFFRRVTKFKKLSANGFLAFFKGNTLNKFDEQTFGVDGYVDVIVAGDEVFAFNHIALERIFRLKEQFCSKAGEALTIISRSNSIENFEQFEADCIADQRIHKTLARMLDNNVELGLSFQNFAKIKETIFTFDLNIDITEEEHPQIVYNDKSQLFDILRLINDAYCKSTILERNVIQD